MEFTIYSIGSAAYLEEILNAVAMISGTGDIEALAKVGLIIGVLILGFQAVMNGTGIQFQKMLVCAIMYLAMYGPTGRALIEDVYTGDVAVVDNVPLGPLAVGSIVSTIGYNITDTFETAFSVPGMTEYGFADPLDTLVKVRKVANNVQSMPSVTGTGNASLLASWANYLRECTLTATNSNPVAMRDVFTNPDAIGAIRFDSSVYYTKIYDGSADGVTLSCRDAYTTLRGATDTAQDAMLDDVAKSFAKPGALLDSTALEARLNNALFSLTGAATDARAYTVTAVLLPILEGAPGQRAIEDMQGAAAIMMGQAIQQQNTQWAAEGSMFTKYIRPFMTFFEGFIYAITPLMAFVIVLGGFGIGLVSKYLLILIWMMLWMPVLSIVNLYTISTTKAKIEGILGSSTFVTEGLSFQNMRDMMPIIETQIGVAGMMASATPALCMFLVYGTSVAASGIAARLNGSDTINEKIASPDVLQPGAGMSMTSQVSSDPTRGSRQTGSEEYRPTINTGAALEKARQSASENLASSSMSYNQAFQKQLGQSVSNASSLAEVAEIGGKVASALGTSSNSGYGAARSQAIAAGYSEQEVDAFTAQVAGGVGAQAGLGKVASADMGGKLQSSTQQSSGSSTQRTDSNAIEQNLRSAIQSSFSKEQAQSTAERLSSSQDFKKDASFTDALSKQSTDLQQSKEAYSNVEAFKQNFGMSSSISLDALANKAIGDGTAGQLVSNLDKLDDKDRAAAAERFEAFKTSNAGTMGNQNATVAAAAYALAGVGRYDLLGDALGAKYEGINPDANAGLEAVGSNGNAAAFDGRGVPQAGFDPNAERSRLISDGQAGVSKFAGDGQSAVEGDFNSRLDSSQANLKDEIGARWRDTGQKTDYDRIMGSNVNMPAWAARAGANSHKEEYELDSMLAAKRREAEDEFGLPPVLAEVSARADIGYLTQQDMGNAVVTLQKEYGMDRNEALGAVEATVTGTYGSKEGGKDFSDIQNYFSGDQVNSALRPDSSTRPPNILRMTD